MRETLVPFWGAVLGLKSETLVPFRLIAPRLLSHVSELQPQRMVLPFSWSQRLARPRAGQAAPAVLIPAPIRHVAGSATTATFEGDERDWTEHGRAECRTTSPASHSRMPARRSSLLARALEGTRSSRSSRWRVEGLPAKLTAAQTVSVGVGHRLISKPISLALMSPQKSGHILALTPPQNCGGLLAPTQLRNKLSPSPHPTLDALAVVQRGGEWGVEDAERPAFNPDACLPPWPSLTSCHPRRRSEGRAMRVGRLARTNGGSSSLVGRSEVFVSWRGRGRAAGFDPACPAPEGMKACHGPSYAILAACESGRTAAVRDP